MNRSWTRKVQITLGLAAALLAVSGCSMSSVSNRDDTSTIIVDENYGLVCALVEPRNGDYTEAELSSFITAQIEAVAGTDVQTESTSSSGSSGEAPVRLDNLDLRDDLVHIEMSYASWQDYVKFNAADCFVGTIAEAMDQGYTFDRVLLDENGAPADAETINERAKEWKVLIIEEPMNVRVPDKILYTTENMEVTGRLTAVYAGGQDRESGPDAEASSSESNSEAAETADSKESGADEKEASSSVSGSSSSQAEADSSAADSTTDGKDASGEAGSAKDRISRFAVDDFDESYIIFK